MTVLEIGELRNSLMIESICSQDDTEKRQEKLKSKICVGEKDFKVYKMGVLIKETPRAGSTGTAETGDDFVSYSIRKVRQEIHLSLVIYLILSIRRADKPITH